MNYLYRITIFLGAFLLFSIQPLVGKQLLPLFGGGASVWTTLILFFTTALFLGYGYAHIISRMEGARQRRWYLISIGLVGILFLGMLLFRNTLFTLFPLDTLVRFPVSALLILGTLFVGLPYVLLATITTTLQSWYEKERGEEPYYLYAISNVGSLLGLISYPFFIEPYFSLPTQQWVWAVLFFIFCMCLLRVVWSHHTHTHVSVSHENDRVPAMHVIRWVVLSALPVAMFLITTTQITEGLPTIPLLWIVPFGLYLLSYAIAFSGSGWYVRTFHATLLLCVIIVSAIMITRFYVLLPSINMLRAFFITNHIIIYTLLFNCFLTGLVCHAELYRIRPHSRFLSRYYLSLTFGGALASLMCSVVFPMVFSEFLEMPAILMVMAACVIALLYVLSEQIALRVQYVVVGVVVIGSIGYTFFVALNAHFTKIQTSFLDKSRNFYGVSRVIETQSGDASIRVLMSGATDHGSQLFQSSSPYEPTMYYARDTGVGILITQHPKYLKKEPMRIGVVGMGVGTLSGYCRSNDYLRYYELNPDVIRIADAYFSYNAHCRELGGRVDVVPGDGRLSLQQELIASSSQQFDVLVIDAFTDGVVPLHLLTQEAVRVYISHLAEGGVIAFHVSNAYIDFPLALATVVRDMGVYTYMHHTSSADWFFISPAPMSSPVFSEGYRPTSQPSWTDSYSNILPFIKSW